MIPHCTTVSGLCQDRQRIFVEYYSNIVEYKYRPINSFIAFLAFICIFPGIYVANLFYENYKTTCIAEPIGFEYITRDDFTHYDGYSNITTHGQAGEQITCSKGNGTLVSKEVSREPIDQVASVGVKNEEPAKIFTPVYVPSNGCPVTTCNDGSCSSSVGRGTCSWHGGVDHY